MAYQKSSIFMMAVLRSSWRPLLVLFAAGATFLGAYYFFHRGYYDPPDRVEIPFEDFALPSSDFKTFVDSGARVTGGLLVVDGAHRNDFAKGEISVLLARVADRGYEIEFMGTTNFQGRFSSLSSSQRTTLLEDGLRRADALLVILPEDAYLEKEVDLVEGFVDKGGKLLLIADPTRDHDINPLAGRFGLAFQPDLLFNTVEHDINHQNIFVQDFIPDQTTDGLTKVALYTAGSIESQGGGLVYTDSNTRSTIVERIEPFYPIVKVNDGRVLAISDLTFMIPPQNSILDNDRLLSNIADYLTDGQREFELADFPSFFKDDVDILLGRPSLVGAGTQVKETLSTFHITSEIRGVEDLTRDTVFLGLYEDSLDVVQYLQLAGIQLDSTLRTPFMADIETTDTAIILLHKAQDRFVLVVLSQTEPALNDMVFRLETGVFRSGLVSQFLGIYRTF